jgi:hypothetical protein
MTTTSYYRTKPNDDRVIAELISAGMDQTHLASLMTRVVGHSGVSAKLDLADAIGLRDHLSAIIEAHEEEARKKALSFSNGDVVQHIPTGAEFHLIDGVWRGIRSGAPAGKPVHSWHPDNLRIIRQHGEWVNEA